MSSSPFETLVRLDDARFQAVERQLGLEAILHYRDLESDGEDIDDHPVALFEDTIKQYIHGEFGIIDGYGFPQIENGVLLLIKQHIEGNQRYNLQLSCDTTRDEDDPDKYKKRVSGHASYGTAGVRRDLTVVESDKQVFTEAFARLAEIDTELRSRSEQLPPDESNPN